MKVLHLIGGGDVGGAKVHVLSLANELRKYIDVKIVSLRPGTFADDALAMGLDVEVVKSGNIIADIKRVVQIIDEGGYRIIHSHGSKANMFALVARRFTHVPAVTTVHSDYRLDYMHNIFKKISFGMINTVALRFMDYYIGVSSNFKRMLTRRNFNPKRIFTIYNGIDFETPSRSYPREDFSRKYHLDLKDNDIVVGILARLYPVKGIDTLIQAAGKALKHSPNLKFLIGGDGEDRRRLEQKAEELNIRDSVFFLGWIDDPNELMSNLDINVLTSISESFPYSILEGARFGKATISSRVGGIPDLITDGDNGYLFDPGDSQTLARYILELAHDGQKRAAMGERIYHAARDKFSLASMCDTQLGIYHTILAMEEDRWKKTHPVYDAIISGYYGFKNIGDEAMLQAIIDNLRMYKKDIKIIVLSRDPEETAKTYGVDSVKRTNLFFIYRAMKSARLFIYGGGNIIQDTTSTRSLFYYLGTTWLAKRMGLKVMFYANGIGPLNRLVNQKFTKNIINKVDVVTLREELSLAELKRLGINKPHIVLTADPALAIRADLCTGAESIFLQESIDVPGPYVGISIRQWPGQDVYSEAVARTADYLSEKYGIKPVFIPMHYPGDILAAESVVNRMKSRGYILRGRYNVPQTMGIISRMDMLIGMRLHALIFAAIYHIPIIGLIYEPKVEGFLRCIRQPSAGDVRMLDPEGLKNLADQVWNSRDEISRQLELDVAPLREKAYENARIAVELAARDNPHSNTVNQERQ